MEIKEPIVITPEQEVETETTDEDILRTAKGESGNAKPIVGNVGGKRIVNTILVNEVKYLIAKAIEEILPKLGFKTVVVDELPTVGENGILYFVPNGGENPNAYDEYVWVAADSDFEKVGSTELPLDVATLSGDNNFTGDNIFSSGVGLGNKWEIVSTSDVCNIKYNGSLLFSLETNGTIYIHGDLIPVLPNLSKALGNSTRQYKEGYIGKIIDSNGSYSSDNVFNFINASDIVNNTLTQAQYDLITNGKPTLIKGTLNGCVNPTLYPGDIYGSTYNGLIIGQTTQQIRFIACRISTVSNNHTISYQSIFSVYGNGATSFTGYELNIGTRLLIYGKSFPNNPSNTGTFINKMINGTWSWENEIPVSVSLTDGGTISDTTLQGLIARHQPIVLNGFTCYFSCDDGTNYQYVSTRYDSGSNKNHINVITINKSTWVATFHTSDLALS